MSPLCTGRSGYVARGVSVKTTSDAMSSTVIPIRQQRGKNEYGVNKAIFQVKDHGVEISGEI